MKDMAQEKTAGMSVIVPFLNEEDGIGLFCETIDEYVKTLIFPIELVFVNDGSTDRTEEILKGHRFEHVEKARLISLSKNYGSHAAIRAGLTQAGYDICTWIGSDLQEPLELIPEGYQKIREGYDVVYIEKETIQVSKANRTFSKIYSRLVQKYAVSSYSSGGISTIVFNGKIKEMLNNNIESNSSIMLQIMDAGFRCITIPMNFHERATGQSKWTMKKKIKLFIDSFVAFSFAPIRLVTIIGGVLFAAGIVIGLIAIINKLINPAVPTGYSTLVCILALGFGVTNISLGIVAEYLWRAYDAARGRPCFIIAEKKDLTTAEAE